MPPSGWLTVAIGAVLALVPFVPIERLFGAPERAAAARLVPPLEWLLGMFVFGAVAWLGARLLPRLPARAEAGLAALDRRVSSVAFSCVCLAALAGLLVLTSIVVFRHRPLLVDSVVQLFQAHIFATGRLTAPVPPGEAFVATQHMLVRGSGWFSQYPPGHAAVLAPGVLLGAAWVVPVVLSLGTAALLYRFAVSAWDERTGRVTLLLLLFAPFFWIMGASFMNHVTCLFFAACFLYSFRRWEAGGNGAWALIAGLALGLAGLARPLTALAVAAVFAPVGLAHAFRRRRGASVASAAAGGLCAVGAYLVWNAATTGHALVPGYLELWGSSHGIGFHTSPWGEAHTPWTGLRNELIDLSMLAAHFLEWPIPALLPVGLYLGLTGGRDPWDRRLAAGLIAIPVAYFFYWHRDAYLGPRFLYTSLLFLAPLTARSLLALGDLPADGRRIRQTALLIVLLSFAYTGLYAAPNRVTAYASSLTSMKIDLPRLARQAGIDRGVVFVAVSWGNRLLVRMRAAGAGAALAERTYRRVDHCEIERLLRTARTDGWDEARLRAALERLPTAGEALGRESPNGDPTLRLVIGRSLPPDCRSELEHDLAGYGNWLPFLLANHPDLEADVLFVRDLRDRNPEFLARRPGRQAWLYRPSGFTRLETTSPELTP
ncbi:MAG: glycosyltransferase family 39 protein [Gemmatimonadota bacterium]